MYTLIMGKIRRAVIALLVFATCFVVVATTAARDNSNNNDWYTRYPHYPPYCSTPDQMATRSIPPLPKGNQQPWGESRLQHVAVVIRHGARAPYSGGLRCWDNYFQTVEWDACNLTTISGTTPVYPYSHIYNDINNLLFDKQYDGFSSILDDTNNNVLHNQLGTASTCQVGQLIWQGYDQEAQNGQFLRDAYLYNADNYNHDPRMRLIDETSIKIGQDIYFRSDDQARTLLSGQVLLSSLLEGCTNTETSPIMHTVDSGQDYIYPNGHICPRLSEMNNDFYKSDAYKDYFVKSDDANQLKAFMHDVLGLSTGQDMDAIDCLMTTMCTDKTLPDVVNDYDPYYTPTPWIDPNLQSNLTTSDSVGSSYTVATSSSGDAQFQSNYGDHLFQRLTEYDSKKYTLLYEANEGAYSKLSMALLWTHIMKPIKAIIAAEDTIDDNVQVPKLSLFSGHDTTLMPLLISLGGSVFSGEWPPYASMFVLELHEINIDGNADRSLYKSEFAFRILYNGKILTDHLVGCPPGQALCDIQVLQSNINSFTSTPINEQCQKLSGGSKLSEVFNNEISNDDNTGSSKTSAFVFTSSSVLLLVILMTTSALIGSVATFVCLTKRLPSAFQAPTMVRGLVPVSDKDETDEGTTLPRYTDDVSDSNDEDDVHNIIT